MQKKFLLLTIIMLFLVPIVGANSVEITQNNISGSITSNIELDNISASSNGDKDIFLGAEIGVYIFSSKGALKNFIETGSQVTNIKTISDINQNNKKELIVTTSDAYFPNVLCYDSITGEKIWDYSAEMEVYDEDMMWTMKQLPVIDLETSDDDEIYLSVGYNVICLDKNGNKQGSFESSDNIWDIALVDENVVFGDQNGFIYRFDKHLDNLIWKKKISKGYTVTDSSSNEVKGTVTRSVWDIVPVKLDGVQCIAATCEDGYLYILDWQSGNIKDSTQIIHYVDSLLSRYYLESSDWENPAPTGIGGFNYFNIRALEISDVTNDGTSELAIYTYPGSRANRGYQAYEQKIYIVDPTAAYIRDSKEFDTLSYVEKLNFVNNGASEYLILPSTSSKLNLISTNDLSSTNSISLNFSLNLGENNNYIFNDLEEDYFLLFSDQDDILKLYFNGSIEWFYPRINDMKVKEGNFVGSNHVDLLVYSQENTDSGDFLSEGSSRMVYVINGETKKLSWSQELSYNESTMFGGLKNVELIQDINNDSIEDIVCYMQPDDNSQYWDEQGMFSFLVTICGATGEMIYWSYVVNNTFFDLDEDTWFSKIITSLDIVSDVSGDGISDFIVGSDRNVYILNSTNGEIVWHRTNDESYALEPEEFWDWTHDDRLKYFSLGDINNDGYDDLIQISWGEMWVLTSTGGSTLSYNYEKFYSTDDNDGDFDRDGVHVIDDVNGDGASDIIFSVWLGEGLDDVYRVYSGKTGNKLLEFKRWGTSVDFACSDFNGDGANESIIFYSEGESAPKIEIWDGKNEEIIWTHSEGNDIWWLRENYNIRSISPVCPVDDINNNGYNDLAIGWFYPYEKGAEIKVYDIFQDKHIKTINVEAKSEEAENEVSEWIQSVATVSISDITGDGFGEVATIMPLGESNQLQFKLVIVDIKNAEIICEFNAIGTDVKSIENLIYTYGSGGAIYFLNPEKTLTITSPADEKTVSSPIKLLLDEERDETTKIIMVDGKNIMKTRHDEAEFDIRKGRHKITVYSFDRNGKGVQDSIYVTVEKESSSELSLIISAVILISILFVPKLIPLVKKPPSKKKKLKGGADK